ERIVDDLEARKPDQKYTHASGAACGRSELAIDAFDKFYARRRTGQGIVLREESQPLLDCIALGDVAEGKTRHASRRLAAYLRLADGRQSDDIVDRPFLTVTGSDLFGRTLGRFSALYRSGNCDPERLGQNIGVILPAQPGGDHFLGKSACRANGSSVIDDD